MSKTYAGKAFAAKDLTISSSDDMSFQSLLSIKSEDLPELPELTKVPIQTIMANQHVFAEFTDFQLMAEIKRRRMFQEEREALKTLQKGDSTPKRSGRGSPSRQQFYNVDKILERRGNKPHEFYRVHWEGYPEHEGTWEPVENLLMSDELVDMVTMFNMREMFTQHPYIEV